MFDRKKVCYMSGTGVEKVIWLCYFTLALPQVDFISEKEKRVSYLWMHLLLCTSGGVQKK